MVTTTRKAWTGGIIRGGRYVIREQVLGRRWTFTIRVGSEDEALAELALFRRDPLAYAKARARERQEATAAAVMLDDATLLDFLKWSRGVKHNTDRAHGPISREHNDRAVRAACAVVKRPDAKIGIPAFTPAMLRHTGATLSLEAGENPAAISEQLGHSDPRTRARFYTVTGSAPKVRTLR